MSKGPQINVGDFCYIATIYIQNSKIRAPLKLGDGPKCGSTELYYVKSKTGGLTKAKRRNNVGRKKQKRRRAKTILQFCHISANMGRMDLPDGPKDSPGHQEHV